MKSIIKNRIPVSLSLSPTLQNENIQQEVNYNKKRIFFISLLAVGIAVFISVIAKLLIFLIELITNISFYGEFSFVPNSPADNSLGYWVIIVPVIGGLIIGIMALYGSKAIRGHGIPEAMEQILTNQSKIKPAITYLKPLSSAISIGTGGPFGAEGPIIATGGALGSTIGQLLNISNNERKILLASGATAGMAAIFGSPIAAMFLAIELLLFEFSPRSIIPVALACITGAVGHQFFFGTEPVFNMNVSIESVNSTSLLTYSFIGILIGLISILITKSVYLIEDYFEKLPVHWMWWPAIGGIGVGVIGYYFPKTLGVGYNNITELLDGNMSINLVLSLCFMKFFSWAISLGSGTSGGTLAPLLTIGGATGILLANLILIIFPNAGITYPLAALVGMSAMFAGASRALITSILFALETTYQTTALLPLLAACSASFLVSYFLMDNTIMTEKIARRGIATPNSFEPDLLEKYSVHHVLKSNGIVFSENNTIEEIRNWLAIEKDYEHNYFIVSGDDGEYKGIISSSSLFNMHLDTQVLVGEIIKRKNTSVTMDTNLRKVVEMMSKENVDVLPVVSADNNEIKGILSYMDILQVYKFGVEDHTMNKPSISIKNGGYKIILRGKNLLTKK